MAPSPAQAEVNLAAFRRDLVALVPQLRAFARGLCGRADFADDLVQEAISRAWAARARFQPGTNMRAWTFTILRNHFLNDLRRARREDVFDPEQMERQLVSPPQQEARLHLEDLQKALLALSPERREALLLVGASGFSYEEAARICGVALGTLKSRIARGRRELAALLEPAAHDPGTAER